MQLADVTTQPAVAVAAVGPAVAVAAAELVVVEPAVVGLVAAAEVFQVLAGLVLLVFEMVGAEA